MHRSLFSLLVACAGALAAGCGGVDLPDRARVQGLVTIDGQPVTTGEITFMPDEARGTTGPSATGTIDATGRYRLTTDHQGRGGVGQSSVSTRYELSPVNSANPGRRRRV